MDSNTYPELEEAFLRDVGVTRIDFYRFFRHDLRKLLEIVEGQGEFQPRQRALASRALAYVTQANDAVPDSDPLLGHVDDYVVVLVARDELFPEEPPLLSAEALLEALSADQRERVVRAIELVLESSESFPADALREPLQCVLDVVQHRLGQPRELLRLVKKFFPQFALEMIVSAIRGDEEDDE